MDKYGRNYELIIQDRTGITLATVQYPLTLEFDILRNTFSSANDAQIRIFNLNEISRGIIRQDMYDFDNRKLIFLYAGYGDNLPLIFSGTTTQAWSVREGTDWVTTMECFDMGFGFINSRFNNTYPSGTQQKTIITDMVNSLSQFGIQKGAIGSYPGAIQMGNTYTGSPVDLLREQMTNGGFCVDNGKAHCLNDNEAIAGEPLVLNAQSGLLGTPLRELQYLNVDILFEPRLFLYQLVRLESQDELADFNKLYKVKSVAHKGMISGSVCGEAKTSVGLIPGDFTEVQA